MGNNLGCCIEPGDTKIFKGKDSVISSQQLLEDPVKAANHGVLMPLSHRGDSNEAIFGK
jgi:hypothetical protein